MADDDQSSKTEEPTARRLEQGRERGQVAHSQDVQTWAALVASTMVLALLVPSAGDRLVRMTLRFIEQPDLIRIDLAGAGAGMGAVLLDLGALLAPILLLLAACGLGCSLAQSGLIWAPSRLEPDFGKMSPIKGLGRLLGMKALIEFAKGWLKIAAVMAILATVVLSLLPGIESWADLPLIGTLRRTHRVLVRVAGSVAAVMTLIAIADFVYQRFSFMQQMRMTKQELRDEFRQSDGDPQVKARIRRIRNERAKQRMMAAVPTATVVITNPTHYAVALAYDIETMTAPKVVAKGVDSLAFRIRTVAEENDVPVVENPPLARALHGAVEVDDDIPPEHYQAVAQIIGFVMRKRGPVHAGR